MTTEHTNIKKQYCLTSDVQFLVELSKAFGVSAQEADLLYAYFVYSGNVTRKKQERSHKARVKIRDLFEVIPRPDEGRSRLRIDCLVHLLDVLNS